MDYLDGTPCWADLITSSLPQAQEFYAGLFGWTYQAQHSGELESYLCAYKDGHLVAGLLASSGHPDAGTGWTTYLQVQNVEATVNAAQMHEGEIYLKPVYMPSQGSLAVIGEPSGIGVGLWESGSHPEFELRASHGAPAWHELRSDTFHQTAGFYEKVLGWRLRCFNDSHHAHYHVLGRHHDLRTAVRDFSHEPGRDSGWHIYFQVDDIHEAGALAESLGGTLLRPVHPSTLGLTAEIADPGGAAFSIVQPAV